MHGKRLEVKKISHVKPYYGEKEIKIVTNYLKGDVYLTEFKYTKELEEKLAKFLNVSYVSIVSNGTVALYLSLLASGIGKGDKVIVPDITMIATPNAVKMVGATPILTEVDWNGCLDIDKISLDKKVKAIIYVDLNGRSGDMYRVKNFCEKNKLVFIEDSCQALGSKYEGQYLGSFGRFGCFSMGFHKIITTGQGGFIVSHTQEDYETIERLKDFGRLKGGSDVHDHLGFNFKFTDLQAVFGIEQLKTMRWKMKKKRQLYQWYNDNKPDQDYVPWFIEYKSNDIKGLHEYLKFKEIETRLFYPPIHTQKIYKQENKFPIATEFSHTTLWLPSSLDLTKQDVKYIREEINAYI